MGRRDDLWMRVRFVLGSRAWRGADAGAGMVRAGLLFETLPQRRRSKHGRRRDGLLQCNLFFRVQRHRGGWNLRNRRFI